MYVESVPELECKIFDGNLHLTRKVVFLTSECIKEEDVSLRSLPEFLLGEGKKSCNNIRGNSPRFYWQARKSRVFNIRVHQGGRCEPESRRKVVFL